MLNTASRTRSLVGRVVRPGGAASRRPRQRPATILISRREGIELLHAVALTQRRGQERVLGLAQAGVPGQEVLGDLARALEEVLVVGHARRLELAEARLAGADELALLAQLEVDLGQRE